MADEVTSRLVYALGKMQKRIEDLEKGARSPQLGNSSLDLDSTRGYIPLRQNGVERGRIGRQPDGTVAFTSVNNSTPPGIPFPPICEPLLAGIRVTCNGIPGEQPHDFSHVKVYCDGIHVGNISQLPGRYIVSPLSYESHGFQLSSVNLSGTESDPTDFQFATPNKAVGTDITDGIIDALKIADEAITAAKIAVGAVTNTKIGPLAVDLTKLADGSVDATKLLDDAVTSDKIAAAAVVAEAIASNAIIAGKIAAGTITTAEIAALTIQAGNIAADAIAAGKIAADAVTAREIQALAVTADKLAANSVLAGAIAAGAITADKLAAELILASRIIIGDPDDWHLELNAGNSPILWTDNQDIGFAVAKDPTTEKSNVYMSGRMEFGDGSQVDSDIIDLQELTGTGTATPKMRQVRYWTQSAASTSITPYYLSVTQKSNLIILGIWQVGVSGTPNCSQPAGSTLLYSFVSGTNRLTVYYIENPTASRTFETFNTGGNTCRWQILMAEVQGCLTSASLDDFDSAAQTGTGTLVTPAITPVATDTFQFALFGQTGGHSPGDKFGSGINGFTKTAGSGSDSGIGSAFYTKKATTNASSSTTVNSPSINNSMNIIASFKLAPASTIPAAPNSDRTIRFYTRKVNGVASPHIMQSDGYTYPITRGPYCKVTLPSDTAVITAGVDTYAQNAWNVTSDYYNMVSLSSVLGTFSSITLPVTGLYMLEMHTVFQQSTNSTSPVIHFMTANSRSAAASVLRGNGRFLDSNDGARLSTTRTIRFGAGLVLYWGHYVGANASIWGLRNNVSTEIGVTYLGPGA
jgi:hypothetical protein